MRADVKTKKSGFWEREREKNALLVFHKTAREVPAYRDFLKKNGVKPNTVQTFADFELVPTVDKNNYLCAYSIRELSFGGTLKQPLVFTATSGSSGTPFYFHRSRTLGERSAAMHELFLQNDREAKRKTTLVIVAFGMGVWIGGLITYEAFQKLSEKGYPLSIITCGTNKKEIYEAFKHVAPHYDSVILCGCPPFIKDVLFGGKAIGVSWKNYDLKIICAAESFSEEFREHLAECAGIEDSRKATANIYGSAELGTMAIETPLSILARKTLLKNKALYNEFFDTLRPLPTLAQYNPSHIVFEEVDGELLCTSDSSLPLVRYRIGDSGGVFSYNTLKERLHISGIFDNREKEDNKFLKTSTELPFVYVYERTDFSVKLYGALIYPGHIKSGLLDPEVEPYCSGRFTMCTKYDDAHEQFLEVHAELKQNVTVTPSFHKRAIAVLVAHLLKHNAEYENSYKAIGIKAHPRLVFWKYGDGAYFTPGIKQRWVVS